MVKRKDCEQTVLESQEKLCAVFPIIYVAVAISKSTVGKLGHFSLLYRLLCTSFSAIKSTRLTDCENDFYTVSPPPIISSKFLLIHL